MKLRNEQIEKLRKPFDEIGAFQGCSEEKIKELLNGIMDYYLTLARINLRLKKQKSVDAPEVF